MVFGFKRNWFRYYPANAYAVGGAGVPSKDYYTALATKAPTYLPRSCAAVKRTRVLINDAW